MATPAEAPPTTNPAEFFDKASSTYERFTGGCTRDVAKFLLAQSPIVDPSSVVLDNACGTGIITQEILQNFSTIGSPRPKIRAVDIAPSMISNLTNVASQRGWMGGVDGLLESSTMDAQELTFPDNTFTHSYTNFGIFFVPEPEKAAAHIYRTLQPGGRAYVTSWSKLGYLPAMQSAQSAVRPDTPPFEIPIDKEWFHQKKLQQVLESGGFDAAKMAIQKMQVFFRGENLDDLVDILKLAFSKFSTEDWDDEEKEKWCLALRESLTEEQKASARIEMEAFVAIAEK